MKRNLRIVFIGTPDFAVESLKCIHESGREVVAVVTAPDKKAGRGRQLRSSPVKQYALAQNIPVLQPLNLKSSDFQEELANFKADIQVVVAFRMLPESVWNMPALGTFNLHASLLPKYRGAAPINWAIINGEKETGLTTFFLKHQIDTGDVLMQESVAIDESETAGSLHDKLMLQGGQLVLKSLAKIEEGDYQLISQAELVDQNEPMPGAPKIFKQDCKINWTKSAEETDRFIRGLSPYPTAWTTLISKMTGKELMLKIFKTSLINENGASGNLAVENNAIKIACSSGTLAIEELQLEGKRRMSAGDLLNGFNISDHKLSMN